MSSVTKRTLFEIGKDMEALDDLLFEAGGDLDKPEVAEALGKWFDEVNENFKGKVDNYAALIRTLECRAAARQSEIDRLAKRVKADTNAAKGLKERLMWVMKNLDLKRVETERFRVTVAGNGGAQAVGWGNVTHTPVRFQKLIPAYTTLDHEAVRIALEAGEDLKEFAHLQPRGTHLNIK